MVGSDQSVSQSDSQSVRQSSVSFLLIFFNGLWIELAISKFETLFL